jgi:hypothetical protein
LYHRYHCQISLLTWISLAFLVVAVVGSIAVAAVAGWRFWRTFRAFSRRTTGAIDGVVQRAEQAERRATALTGSTERMNVAVAGLQESLAHLAVLRAAYADARAGLTFRVPKK